MGSSLWWALAKMLPMWSYEFQVKFDLDGQWSPKQWGSQQGCFASCVWILIVLPSIGSNSSCGHAQNGPHFDFEVKFDLEIHYQWTPNNRESNQSGLHFWSNFGGSSWNRWQIMTRTPQSWYADAHTDRHMQATTMPEGQNWPRVKIGQTRRNTCVNIFRIIIRIHSRESKMTAVQNNLHRSVQYTYMHISW